MMRVSKVLGSLFVLGATLVALSASAGDNPDVSTLVKVTCKEGGAVTVEKKDAKWHLNNKAPWKWEGSAPASLTEDLATFKGKACTGTIKAYVCSGDTCLSGPVKVPAAT
jgi:hypothetical protein